MFCLLKTEYRKNTVIEKIFGKFIKDRYEMHTVPVFKGAPFYVLNATVGKNGVDWDEVLYYSGKCAGRLIVDENTKVPKQKGIGVYNGKVLYDIILRNTFLKAVKSICRKDFETLCLIDAKGAYSDFILLLVPYFERVYVVTEHKEKYERVCEEILSETGLSIVFMQNAADAYITINADNKSMTVKTGENIFNIKNGEDFEVPEIYEKLYDGSVDRMIFFSALYELCGVFSLAKCEFQYVSVNGIKKKVDSINLLDTKGNI